MWLTMLLYPSGSWTNGRLTNDSHTIRTFATRRYSIAMVTKPLKAPEMLAKIAATWFITFPRRPSYILCMLCPSTLEGGWGQRLLIFRPGQGFFHVMRIPPERPMKMHVFYRPRVEYPLQHESRWEDVELITIDRRVVISLEELSGRYNQIVENARDCSSLAPHETPGACTELLREELRSILLLVTERCLW